MKNMPLKKKNLFSVHLVWETDAGKSLCPNCQPAPVKRVPFQHYFTVYIYFNIYIYIYISSLLKSNAKTPSFKMEGWGPRQVSRYLLTPPSSPPPLLPLVAPGDAV